MHSCVFISVGPAVQSKFILMEPDQIGGKWETRDKQPMLGRTVAHFDHHTFLSLLQNHTYKVIQMLKNILGWFGKDHKKV